jgi:predicted nucleotidyltransferase
MLSEVARFVRSAAAVAGVKRISLIGSIVTPKPDTKDVDLLVVIANNADLAELARCGRRLQGKSQSLNRGADIFLADESGRYLGRTCSWRECAPGLRMACVALHCGRRQYLNDDLANLCLNETLIATPPVDLWPVVRLRRTVPADVQEMLKKLSGLA